MASNKNKGGTEKTVARHVVTVGSFDGVHRGHQYLLQRVLDRAGERGARSAAVTFDPLPLEFLRPEHAPQRITSTSDRLLLLSACGIDDVVLLSFDAELSNLAPDAFIDRLYETLRPELFVVGADFAFGHNRAGTLDVLRQLGGERGFEVEVHERIGDGTSDFSSTRVRQALSSGDVGLATELLGRPFSVSGIVVHGNHRGRTLGFPTANLDIPSRQAIPAEGIYAAKVVLDREVPLLPCMVYIGTRPTFGEGTQTVEVNILDFSRDIYGHHLTVLFAERIRPDQSFDSIDALIQQMRRDQDQTVNVLSHLSPEWPGPLGEAVVGIGEGARSREH